MHFKFYAVGENGSVKLGFMCWMGSIVPFVMRLVICINLYIITCICVVDIKLEYSVCIEREGGRERRKRSSFKEQ